MAHTPPAAEAIMNGMRRIVHERTAWDEPPGLGFLHSSDPQQVEFMEMPVPEAVWNQFHHPYHLLTRFAQILARPRGLAEQKASDGLRGSTPAEMCGIFLRSEAWAPPPHMMEEIGRRKQANGGASHLDYSKLPGRVELRQVAAVDATGRYYMASQRRGDPHITAAVQGRDAELSGRLYDALESLLRALLTPPVPGTFAREPKA
jgi:hypothetical protein